MRVRRVGAKVTVRGSKNEGEEGLGKGDGEGEQK